VATSLQAPTTVKIPVAGPEGLDSLVLVVPTVNDLKMAKLIFPQEIEVWYVLPAIRKKIALKLVEQGLSQKKVAELMGITPAAVSQYKKKKRAKEDFFDGEMERELAESVMRIVNDNNQLGDEIIRLCNLAKEKGIICRIYRDICALKGSENCLYCKKADTERVSGKNDK